MGRSFRRHGEVEAGCMAAGGRGEPGRWRHKGKHLRLGAAEGAEKRLSGVADPLGKWREKPQGSHTPLREPGAGVVGWREKEGGRDWCFLVGLVSPGLAGTRHPAAQPLRGLGANGTFLHSGPSSWRLTRTSLPLAAIQGPRPIAFHQVLFVLSDLCAFVYAVPSA